MSYRISDQAWTVADITPTQKLILVYLAHMANKEGGCWPSHETIAQACCIKRETVCRNIKQLIRLGLIKITTKTRFQSNYYQFVLDALGVTHDHNQSELESHPRVTMDHTAVTLDHTPCDAESYPCDSESQPPVTLDHTNILLEQAIEHASEHEEINAREARPPSPPPDSKVLTLVSSTPPAQKPTKAKNVTRAEIKQEFPELTDQLIDDWLTVRKDKGAKSLTRTAWNRVRNQIHETGVGADDCLTCAIENNWRGFEADWFFNKQGGNQHKGEMWEQLYGSKRNDW